MGTLECSTLLMWEKKKELFSPKKNTWLSFCIGYVDILSILDQKNQQN